MGKGVNIPLTISGLKQAKEDLAKLNDELESLDKESDDYIKKSKQLSKAWNEQSEAKAWNEQSEAIDKTTEELIELNKAGKLVGTKFDDLNETLFNAKEEVLPLTSAIGEMEDRLYALAKSGDTSSAEFKALQSEIVKYGGQRRFYRWYYNGFR
jgi:chromosome segregation ATPase